MTTCSDIPLIPNSPRLGEQRPLLQSGALVAGLALRNLGIFLGIFLGIAPTPAHGVIASDVLTQDEQLFPRPEIVRKQVRFWEKIFFTYPATTVVVHESSDPDRIIDVIDYRITGGPQATILPVPRKLREAVTSRYLARYNKAA